MSIDTYDDTDIDIDNNVDTDIDDFEVSYGSANKKAIRKTMKYKYHIRQKLDSITEQRTLDRELDSFSKYWDF